MTDVRVCATDELPGAAREAIRQLLDAAFDGDFSDTDWEHSLGGVHATITEGDRFVAHACVVPRTIRFTGTGALDAGYVEAVAVAPDRQGSGLGSEVMRAIGEVIRDRFEVGVLSTGEWGFYERLGWRRWQGTTWVRHGDGTVERTEEDDDGIMVLLVPGSAAVDLATAIGCDARSGDHW